MPGSSPSVAPSATCRAARGSSPRWRAPGAVDWSSTGRSRSIGIPGEPAELEVEAGSLVSATGEAGQRLLELLGAHGSDATHVAELGVGTNEKAILTGELLEDEKLLGSVHVAFGASSGIGGTIQVPVHLDCVVTKPDLTVDGEDVVRSGRLLV